ncbi:MAG: peptidylprolyl isomerase [Acidobacteriia bacterium]|nr:peptidylprolyl isomerase [Terriglobia bacterium]
MKPLLFLIAAALLSAQAPPSATPETVIAKVDGKDLTLGELQHMLQAYPPAFMQTFQRDPREALKQIFMVRYTAAEGDKLKLGEMDPWKEQIEISRMNVVSAAMFNYTRNTYQVSVEDVEAFYKRNQNRYEEARIKVIKIAFKPGMTGNLSVEEMAKRAVEGAHAGTDRSETEARTLAAGLVKQLRGGGDFAQLVQLYSDDADSKADGGNFGTVKPSSPYSDDFKKAVFALKPGEISDPIAAGPAFYIARVESKSVQPIEKVREQIMDDIKDAHFREYLTDLQKRFTPVIERPDLLIQMNGAGQRPAGK